MRIVFVRHGESGWNAAERIQGQSPEAPGLTPRGREQAEQVALALAGFPADLIVVSDLVRARETAEPIAATLGAPIEIDSRLRERALGIAEGQPSATGLHLAGILADRVVDPDAKPRGGESLRELRARVAKLLLELEHRGLMRVICVTHGGVVRVARSIIGGEPVDSMAWIDVDNASAWSAELGPSKRMPRH